MNVRRVRVRRAWVAFGGYLSPSDIAGFCGKIERVHKDMWKSLSKALDKAIKQPQVTETNTTHVIVIDLGYSIRLLSHVMSRKVSEWPPLVRDSW